MKSSPLTGRAGWAMLALLATAPACTINVDAEGFTGREEKRFQVTGVPELNLVTFDGAIEIEAWDQPGVLVVIERRATTKEQAEEIEIKSEQSGNRISIEARRPSGAVAVFNIGRHISRTAKLIASVPRETNLVARSGDGSIRIERVTGRLELRTDDGSIQGSDLKGQFRARTSDGSVRLDRVDGDADLDTGDGGIELAGTLRTLSARTGDGSVRITVEPGSAMADDWNITTGDGSVALDLPSDFNAELDAHTGDGRVHLGQLELSTSGEMSKSTVRGRLGSGGRVLQIRSGDGTIRLGKS